MSCPKCVIRNARMMAGNETCHIPQATLDSPYQKMMAERAKQDKMWSTPVSTVPQTASLPPQTPQTTQTKRT